MAHRPVPARARPTRATLVRTLIALSWATHATTALAWAGALSLLGVPHPLVLAVALSASLAALVPWRLGPLLWDRPRGALEGILEMAFLCEWCASLGAAPLVVVGAGVGVAVDLARGSPPTTWRWAATAGYGVGALLAVYGVYIRRAFVAVRRVEIPVSGLAAALDGLRVAHLSDLHVGGLVSARQRAAWVRMTNEERADLVAVTGDLVSSGTAFHADIGRLLGELRAAHGVVLSFGNHDHFDGVDLRRHAEAAGVRVLQNEAFDLERGEARLHVAGVDDTWTGRADLPATLAGATSPTLLLCHDPDLFDEARRLGADVVLSGHTHAGQIALPFFVRRWSLASLAHAHTHGLYRRDDAALVVSAGLGTTGLPIRIGAAPEIVVVTLRSAPA